MYQQRYILYCFRLCVYTAYTLSGVPVRFSSIYIIILFLRLGIPPGKGVIYINFTREFLFRLYSLPPSVNILYNDKDATANYPNNRGKVYTLLLLLNNITVVYTTIRV